MRFEFKRPNGSHGLPVIPVIPDYRLSTIEGRNGIGKTLAARLLELLTGGQPFAALPKAWNSLCTDLGQLTITIAALPEQQVVRCELDSATWLGRTEEDCRANPGAVFINDQPADWRAVRQLIKVRRIAGDEGLGETLARTLRETSLVSRAQDVQANEFVQEVGVEVSLLTDSLRQVKASALRGSATELRTAVREVNEARAIRDASQIAFDACTTSLQLHQATRTSLSGIPEQLQLYAGALDQYNEAAARIASAERALTELGRRQAIDAAKQARINRLVTKLLPYRMRRLAQATADEKRTISRLQLEGRIRPAEIRDRIRALDTRIAELEDQNRTDYMADTVRQTQNDIERELRAMPKAAQQQHIATVGREIKANELADGIAIRRRELEGVPKPSVVTGRERSIAQLKVQQVLLRQLSSLYRATDRKQELVDEAHKELAELTNKDEQSGAARDAGQSAMQARADLLAASVLLRQAQAAIEALTSRLADGEPPDPDLDVQTTAAAQSDDEEEEEEDQVVDTNELPPPSTVEEIETLVRAWFLRIEDQLDERCRSPWEDATAANRSTVELIREGESAVASLLGALSSEQAEADVRVQLATKSYEAFVARAAHAEEAVDIHLDHLWEAFRSLEDQAGPWKGHQSAVTAVLSRFGIDAARFAELAEHSAQHTELVDEDSAALSRLEEACRAIETIDQIIAELESSASRVRDSWAITANYLHKFSSDLSPRLESSPYDITSMRASAADALSRWAEHSLSQLLSSEELRSELFDGSPSVSFNLSDLTVSWVDTATNRKRRRPIEAFSSGEQVFAYTRAKLELLSDLKASTTCVVVFLDEFGAFVARDRFAQLMTYIEHDALGGIADQIVVTVPLSAEMDRVVELAAMANLQADKFDPPGYIVVPARVD